MQTFMPYYSFTESCQCLDYRRLGKQRVEAMQLINTFRYPDARKGWVNHPARLMWNGYVGALAIYHNVCIQTWKERGYNNTMSFIHPAEVDSEYRDLENYTIFTQPPPRLLPHWFGDEAFHAAHRSNLLRKAPEHYSQFGWTEGPDLPYVWPTNQLVK